MWQISSVSSLLSVCVVVGVGDVFLHRFWPLSLAGEFHTHETCESWDLFVDKYSSSAHLAHVFPLGSQQEADDTFKIGQFEEDLLALRLLPKVWGWEAQGWSYSLWLSSSCGVICRSEAQREGAVTASWGVVGEGQGAVTCSWQTQPTGGSRGLPILSNLSPSIQPSVGFPTGQIQWKTGSTRILKLFVQVSLLGPRKGWRNICSR